MKPLRTPPPRVEPRRPGNALIVAAMLLSLCILSLIKARYCPSPYGIPAIDSCLIFSFLGDLWISCSQEDSAVAESAGDGSNLLFCAGVEDDEGNAVAPKIVADEAVSNLSRPLCSETSKRSNVCEAEGGIRLQGSSRTIFLHPSLADREWKIKPYCRKHDPPAMKKVNEWTMKPFPSDKAPPRCTAKYTVPALVFSIGGFTDNLFHDFTDVIVPLFISSYRFHGEVQFVVADFKPPWVSRFILILRQLSNYDIIDADNDDPGAVRCFPRVIVGLSFHKELGVDPSKTATGYSIVEFKEMLRKAYGLERPTVERWGVRRKPRLLLISRNKTRVFLNEKGIADMATSLGFDVRVTEPTNKTDVGEFARLVNSADVMIGVHGAGLTNMVFLPAGAVLIQVVPMGAPGWLPRDTFGQPSRDMQLKYLDYHIEGDESSLTEQYPKDHPVLKDPSSIHKQGWYALSEVYLENQNVRPQLDRLKNTLLEARSLLPHNSKEA
ncbi:unnamed protein product [Musa hybrid cultivar]